MYEKISSMIPRNVLKAFKNELTYAGIDLDEKNFVGFVFVFGFATAIAAGFALNFFFSLHFFIGFITGFILTVGGIYYLLNQAGDSKARFVEKILPDALQLIASNMKSGLTTEKALLVSSRPEFGALAIELK